MPLDAEAFSAIKLFVVVTHLSLPPLQIALHVLGVEPFASFALFLMMYDNRVGSVEHPPARLPRAQAEVHILETVVKMLVKSPKLNKKPL